METEKGTLRFIKTASHLFVGFTPNTACSTLETLSEATVFTHSPTLSKTHMTAECHVWLRDQQLANQLKTHNNFDSTEGRLVFKLQTARR